MSTTPGEFVPSARVNPLATGLTWEQMVPGSTFRTSTRTVTESDLIQFITWAGFADPLFLDETHASANGYSGRVVPAALTYCLAEGLVLQTNALTGTGMAFLGMDFSVRGPVYVGDTLHAVVTTTESRATSKPGRGLVRSMVSVRNQHDAEVLAFHPLRLIRGQPADTGP